MIDRVRMLRVASVTIGAIVLLIAAAMLLLVPLLVTINSRFAIAEKQIAVLEQSGIVVNPVDVAALQSRTRSLTEKLAASLPPSPNDYIDLVQSAPSGGIVFLGYVMEKGETPTLQISGTASTREALQRFVAALERNERVATVQSPVSNYVKSTNSPFMVTIAFNVQQ